MFLTIHSDMKLDEDLRYHNVLAKFQQTIGSTIIFIGLISVFNTFYRFQDISEDDRDNFSSTQMRVRRDKRELALQECIK